MEVVDGEEVESQGLGIDDEDDDGSQLPPALPMQAVLAGTTAETLEDVQDLPLMNLGDDTDENGGDDQLESGTSSSDIGDFDGNSEGQRIPRIATWRINLTALSQRYNLYFAAYKNRVLVSQPQSCVTHCLPAVPQLVLIPPPSAAGLAVGGTIDQHFPHQVNHLVVGDFGEEEVLLLAYDDGDVIGFYTRHIEDQILRHQLDSSGTQDVRPFFHENVGKSAWGLAVHKKSRLIAVGSNKHEVALFIPALTGKPFQPYPYIPDEPRRLFRMVTRPDRGLIPSGPPDVSNKGVADLLRFSQRIYQRDANWQFNFGTGAAGDNIPNVAFSDDEHGDADKIVAVE